MRYLAKIWRLERAPIAERLAMVTLNHAALLSKDLRPGVSLRVRLFDDTIYDVVVGGVTAGGVDHVGAGNPDESFSNVSINSFFGRVQECPYGFITMATCSDKLALMVLEFPTQNRQYVVAYNHYLQAHYLYELALDKLDLSEREYELEDDEDDDEDLFLLEAPETEEVQSAAVLSPHLQATTASGPNDPATIDVIVAYTPAAREWCATNATSINHAIRTAHDRGQLTLDNSDVGITLRLMSTQE